MGAIAGLYQLDGDSLSLSTLSQTVSHMTARLAHRGPDASGTWVDKQSHRVGLGHCMLWTTPESLQEVLPQGNRGYMLTADARIDNRDELISGLDLEVGAGITITDSDLILAAYERWGERCPEYLLGDFAFAIWDRREQQLFCARDVMGVRPFVYYRDRQQFIFASEIKALFCHPTVPRRINDLRVAQLLTRELDQQDITLYEDIWRLPAAHSLTVTPDSFRLRHYWQLDPESELKLGSDAEYAEAYRNVFDTAVRCRLRTAFPLGSMLSGGLDSSSLACTARKYLAESGQEQLHTFSTRFDSLPEDKKKLIDESFFVHKVLDQGGFTPHFIEGDQLNPLAHYDKLFAQTDECFFAPNLYYNLAWYQSAQAHQVRVLLDGVDGDSTVSHGHMYMYELMNQGRWLHFLRQARAYAKLTGFPLKNVLWDWGLQGLIPKGLRRKYEDWQIRRSPPWQAQGLNPEFARRLDLARRQIRRSREKFDKLPIQTARHAHWHSLHSGLIQYALEIADKVAIAHQVELRFPFCDRRLMEFCVSLPPEQKFNWGWTRLIHRRGLQGVMPDELRSRLSKANLGTNTKPNLLAQAGPDLEKHIFQENSRLLPYIDLGQARRLYRAYQSDELDEQSALNIYGMATLSMWLKREFDQTYAEGTHCNSDAAEDLCVGDIGGGILKSV